MPQLDSRTIDHLRDSVESECMAFEEVIGILRREQEQLVGGSSDALEEVVARKNAGLSVLERLRLDRLALLDRAGVQRDPVEVERAVGADPVLARLWQRLRALARESQRINTLNGRLVGVRMQFVATRLEALRRARGTEATYDAGGRTDGGGARRVIAAV